MSQSTRYVYSSADSAIQACANLVRDQRRFAVEPGLHEGEVRIIVQPRDERASAAYLHSKGE